MIRNWHTDLVGVESPMVRASEADLGVPIPFTTSVISGMSIIEVGEEALTILKIVSFIASQAVSVDIMSGTLVGNWNTNLFVIEEPLVRAGKTDLVFPVPGSASEVRWVGIV